MAFWRKCRIVLRCLRFAVWFLALAALLGFGWFNLVGLPDFLKTRLTTSLRERGVELEFSRMRLRFVHGFVAENIRLGETKNTGQPTLTAGEMQLRLDYNALLHGRLQLAGIVLHNGKLSLPLSATNTLKLFHLESKLRFETNDVWSLDQLRADFAGINLSLSGSLAHPLEAADWPMFSNPPGGDRGASARSLHEFLDAVARIKFTGTPQLSASFNGDARDVHSFVVWLNARVPDVRTPWFAARHLQAAAQLTAPASLPAKADAALGWWTNIQPFRLAWILRLNDFHSEKINADELRCDGVWHAPELSVSRLDERRGGEKLAVEAQLDLATKDFSAHVAGALDTTSLQPFLTASNAVRGFQHLTFHTPVTLDLGAHGNLQDFSRLAATGRVVLTDCAIRRQTVDRLATDVTYSNLTAEFLHPQLSRAGGAEYFEAEKVVLDLAGEKLFIANGAGRVTPMVVGRAIGPKTAQAMEPYQFLAVPEARVSGWIPIKQKDGEVVQDDADLRVDIVGTTPFRWRKFETPAITGTICWRKTDLILTNATTECYGGTAHGWGVFDVRPDTVGTDFRFFITGTNVDFHRMGLALWSSTNQLAGALSGTVTVTRANSDDWRTWNGYGNGRLRNGLLWNVPIFGIISPVLNVVTPGIGLGNNRATEAAGNFQMTNGVIFTDSLVIQTAMARLDYVGTVDLEQNVRARVTAQLLRNTPVIGTIFSTLLWPVSKAFECEVAGTLGDPKPTPVHAPAKLLLMPLHPIRSVEEMFTPGTSAP